MNTSRNIATEDTSHARDLYLDGHTRRAKRAVSTVLRQNPGDVEAYGLMSRILREQREYQKALEAANAGIAIDPEHVPSMDNAAGALVGLGRPNEALPLLEKGMSILIERADSGTMPSEWRHLQEWVEGTYWDALDEAGEHERALELAKAGVINYNGLWVWNRLHSLVAVGRFEEAKALYGDSPKGRLQARWDIGFHLVFQSKPESALIYFLQCLPYVILNRNSSYVSSHICVYIECAMLAGRYDEAVAVATHWLDSPRLGARDKRRFLLLLAMGQFGLEELDATNESIMKLAGRRSFTSLLKWAQRTLTFEQTYARFQTMIDGKRPLE